jgi:hypothetical protein
LIEKSIVEYAFKTGLVQAGTAGSADREKIAVVGSGPSGLACAQQLNRAGHTVTLFERADRLGGLLRYGIPDFKLEKWVLDRRLDILEQEGIVFKPGMAAGTDVSIDELKAFDAVVLCGGATQSRDLPSPAANRPAFISPWNSWPQQNRLVSGDRLTGRIDAAGKHSDCYRRRRHRERLRGHGAPPGRQVHRQFRAVPHAAFRATGISTLAVLAHEIALSSSMRKGSNASGASPPRNSSFQRDKSGR